jgi:putative ABC transport system permease protein
VKFLGLVWAGLWRKPTRTMLTAVSVVAAFLLFGLLQGVDSAFSLALNRWKLDRLFVDARFGRPLPIAYRDQVAKVSGIRRMTEIAFLRGYYQDPKNGVFAIATNPDIWLAIRPEIQVDKAQIEAVTRIRTGALVSDWLARKNGWKIGDKFTVHTRVRNLQGTFDWTFDVVGMLHNTEAVADTSILLANFKYYDEAHAGARGTVDRFLVRIDDPRHTGTIAHQIDQLFANSAVPTHTESEHASVESDVAALGDINFFTRAVMGAVFFTLLILTGNTMMESMRERICEFAVLKTLGFSNLSVFSLIIAEALLLCVSASLLGLALAAAAFPLAESYVGTAVLPPSAIGLGVIGAIGVGFVSAVIPACRTVRMKVVDALAMR